MVEGEEKIQVQLSEIHLKKIKVETEKALALNPLTWGKIEGCREDRCRGIGASWTLRVVIGGYFLVYRENSGKYRMCLEKHISCWGLEDLGQDDWRKKNQITAVSAEIQN